MLNLVSLLSMCAGGVKEKMQWIARGVIYSTISETREGAWVVAAADKQ